MDNAGVQSYKISIPVAATVSLLTLFAKYLTDSVNRPKGKKKRSTETLVNAAKARLFTAKTGFQRRRDYACLDIELPIHRS